MIITHGRDPSQVALTFDDGPNFTHTVAIIELLEKYNAKGTFFVLGKWVKEFPFPSLKDMVSGGHEIGNHSMTHPRFGEDGKEQVLREFIGCQYQIKRSTGFKPVVFRPPYGAYAKECAEAVEPFGVKTVMWSQMSGDWAADSTEEIVSKINLETDKGEIVLLHDGAPTELGADRHHTVEAVEIVLKKYSGIKKFVTVSELTL